MCMGVMLNSSLAMLAMMFPCAMLLVFGYYEITLDKTATAYAYGVPMGYFIVYEIGCVYTWVMMLRCIVQNDTVVTLITRMWQINYRLTFPVIVTNEIFSFIIALNGSFDPKLLEYTQPQMIFYASSFFICNHVFCYYSKYILKRNDLVTLRNHDRKLFQMYEYLFYMQSFLIFLCFYYSIRFDTINGTIAPLVKFLITHLMYHCFEITRIPLVINVFVIVQFLQVIIDGVNLLIKYDNQSYIILAFTGICVVVSFIYNLHILGQYYLFLRQCRNGHLLTDHQEPPRQFLTENELEQLEVKSFNSQMESLQRRTEAIDMAQLEEQNENKVQCSVCSNDVQKRHKVIVLHCNHLFHAECLKPWLRIKNSCPNCRTPVIKV